MKKTLAMLLFGLVCIQPAFAEEELILLDVEIHAGSEQISHPRVALAPRDDASIHQELADSLLKIVFHSTHIHDDGAEMLIDIDFGAKKAEHFRSYHQTLRWNEPHEFVLSAGSDALAIRVLATPSRTTRGALLSRTEDAEK